MRGDFHVRFCESPEGKFLRATRLSARQISDNVETTEEGIKNEADIFADLGPEDDFLI
jgi:hypothetical protein